MQNGFFSHFFSGIKKKPFLCFKDTMRNSEGIFFFVNVLMGFPTNLSPFSATSTLLAVFTRAASEEGSTVGVGASAVTTVTGPLCHFSRTAGLLIGGATHPFSGKTKEAMTESAT